MKRHLVLILITLLVSCWPPLPPATDTWDTGQWDIAVWGL
jgi:hypothetical protein